MTQDAPPALDMQQTVELLRALAPGEHVTFQTFDDGPVKRPSLADTRHGTLDQHATWLAGKNEAGAGVFVTVNKTDGKGRKGTNVTRVRALFADFDNPEPGTLERLRADHMPPSAIVESSTGKLHAYWFVDGLKLEEFKPLQQAIAQHWGSDPKVCDLPRVMRLPGFLHRKGEPQLVQLLEVAAHRYGREIADRYKPIREPIERQQATASDGMSTYGAAALERACEAVGDAVEGERNDTLNTAAFGIGQLVAGGEIPKKLAQSRLREAAALTGLGRGEVDVTIRSGFRDGSKTPRTAPAGGLSQLLDDLDDEAGEAGAPLPLMPTLAEATPYPVDALPPVLRNAALAIAEHVRTPVALAGQCILGAAAHMAQTRVNTWGPNAPAEGVPCSLFILTLAQSGEGKSSARRLAFQAIDKAERRRRDLPDLDESGCPLTGNTGTKVCGQYSDATFERVAGDFIRGNPAASWDTDEGAQMLTGASLKAETVRATLGGLTRAFDSGTFERTRAHGNAEGSGTAFDRRLCVHLLAQPVTVAEALANPLLKEQGFLPRFLFTSPASLVGTRFITVEHLNKRAYDDPRLRTYWDRCDDILQSAECIDPVTREVHPPVTALDSAAKHLWVDFYNAIEKQSGPLQSFAGLRPFASRGAELALRVATVLAFFDERAEIDKATMQQACSLVRHSLDEWCRYTDPSATDPALQRAIDFMEWLRDPKRAHKWAEFHKSKLVKSGPPALRNAKARDLVLVLLVKQRHLLTNDGGTYRVNPLFPELSHATANRSHAAARATTGVSQIYQDYQGVHTGERDPLI